MTGGDVEVATGEQADAVIVIGGDARIAGTVNTLVVVDGTATRQRRHARDDRGGQRRS